MTSSDRKWRPITASAPAKVILHGEHSVVYGKLALAASVDLRTTVVFKPCKRKILRVNLQDFSEKSLDFDLETLKSLPYEENSEIDEILRQKLQDLICNNVETEEHLRHKEGLLALLYILVAFLQASRVDLVPIEITVSSEIPMGAGLGSSAAFSVSMAAALVQLRNCLKNQKANEDQDRDSICSWAFKSEKIIHGNPSGM